MSLDVLRASAAVDHGELLVGLPKLVQHRLAIGPERVGRRHHPVGEDRHPTHPGDRFAANAAMPSRPSSLVNNDSDIACSSAIECGARSSDFVAATALGPPARIPWHSRATIAATSSATWV